MRVVDLCRNQRHEEGRPAGGVQGVHEEGRPGESWSCRRELVMPKLCWCTWLHAVVEASQVSMHHDCVSVNFMSICTVLGVEGSLM